MTRHFPGGWSGVLIYTSLLLAAACAKPPENPPSPVVAIIGDSGVTLDEFRRVFDESRADGHLDENSEEVKTLKWNLLNQLIEQRLLLGEAARLNLEVDPEELERTVAQIRSDYAPGEFEAMLAGRHTDFEDWKERLRKEMLAQKVVNQTVSQVSVVGDEEVKEYYERHRKEFVHPEKVRARQLVVSTEETARSIRDQLLKGDDFEEIARSRSLSPDKEWGGDMGFITRGEMPEEFDIVFKLGVGKISPIVKTAYGFHMFKVEERRPAQPMNDADAAESIRTLLGRERREGKYFAWLKELKDKTRISINQQLLATPLGPGTTGESSHE